MKFWQGVKKEDVFLCIPQNGVRHKTGGEGMRQPLVLTFDMGTQSARAMLVDPQGTVVHKAQKVYSPPYYSQHPGWAEQSPDFYWQAVCDTSQALKQKAGEVWEDIIAVTCTTIRDTCLCLDKDMQPVRDVIVWIDNREAQEIQYFSATSSMMFRLAGMKDAVELQRKVSACNWIAANQPEIWAKTAKFVFISTWLNYKLCGRLAESTAGAIGHIPYDNKTRTWMRPNDMRKKIFDVRDDQLFELVEPGTELGGITAEAARETGLAEGLPMIATGSDKGCETLGLGCLASDRAALSFGTTATVQLSTPEYVEPFPFIPAYAAVAPGYYNPEVEIYRGFWLISWFKREFGTKEVEEAERLGVSAEELLNNRLREVPPGCHGLVMQPYFTPGLVMPHARGAVIGFSDVHTRIHLYRAIIEGINFALMEGLYSMEKRGKLQVKKLMVAGGGSQSDEICQITADMFGLPVGRTQTHEVSGVGSSLVAFVAKGVHPSYEAAIKAMVHEKDCFMPDMKDHAVYEKLYDQVFIKIFDKLSPLYQVTGEITRGLQ